MKFYQCSKCGKTVGVIKNSGCPTLCCGEPMNELVPGTVEAATEKHIPVVNIEGNIVTVDVGEVAHPMTDAHLIEWVLIETKQGAQRKRLSADDSPKASFALTDDDELVAAYAYCNLHGLWKK